MIEAIGHFLVLCLCVTYYQQWRRQLPCRLLFIDTFYLGQTCYLAGTLLVGQHVGFPLSAELTRLSSLSVIAATCAVGWFHRSLLGVEYPTQRRPPTAWRGVVPIAGFAIVASVVFSYVVFTQLMQGSWAPVAGQNKLMVARKLIASGGAGYYFPGLIKLLRDTLGPAFVFLLVASRAGWKHRLLQAAVIGSLGVAMFFGGQRLPMIALLWCAYVGYRFRRNALSVRGEASGHRVYLPLALGLVVVLLLATIEWLLGRSGSIRGVDTLLIAVSGVFERLIFVVPNENIEAFDYILGQRFGFAELWLSDLLALMPGTDTGFSNELAVYLGGSIEGNAVLGTPLASYVNAGYVGVVTMPVVGVGLLFWLERQSARYDHLLLGGLRQVLLMSLVVCYDPAMFLLNGGLAYLGVLACVAAWSAWQVRAVEPVVAATATSRAAALVGPSVTSTDQLAA